LFIIIIALDKRLLFIINSVFFSLTSDILYDKVYEYKLLETDTNEENMFAEQEFEDGPFFFYIIYV